jgi:hypothetical protein
VDVLALSAIPAELGARLYPGADSDSDVPIAGWAAAYLVVVLVAAAVLARRFRRADT